MTNWIQKLYVKHLYFVGSIHMDIVSAKTALKYILMATLKSNNEKITIIEIIIMIIKILTIF